MDVITGPNQDFHLLTLQRNAQTGQLVLNHGRRVSRQLTAADRYVSARDVLEASDVIFNYTRQIGMKKTTQMARATSFAWPGMLIQAIIATLIALFSTALSAAQENTSLEQIVSQGLHTAITTMANSPFGVIPPNSALWDNKISLWRTS